MRRVWLGVPILGVAVGMAYLGARRCSEPWAPAGDSAEAPPRALPAGPWLTATPSGAIRITTPERWACYWQGEHTPRERWFIPSIRTSCLVPVEFLTNLVFGCPDRVFKRDQPDLVARYDARNRLISFGRQDMETIYRWDDEDRPMSRDRWRATTTRTAMEITYREPDNGDLDLTVGLDEQQRPVAMTGDVGLELHWRGDDLAWVRLSMAGLYPLTGIVSPCGDVARMRVERAPAP